MPKKKKQTYEERMIEALNALPNPLKDAKHRISIVLENDRARSNETRLEHIMDFRHDLTPSDIKRKKKKINDSVLKKDQERTDTYNIYIERNNYRLEYIKISIELNFKKSNVGKIKTIYIDKTIK